MVSMYNRNKIGEIEKIRNEIQKKIIFLKDLNDNYKKSVDKCYPAGISSNAYFISRTEDVLDGYKDHLTVTQEEEIDDLKRQYVIQFSRLNSKKFVNANLKFRKNLNTISIIIHFKNTFHFNYNIFQL